MRKRKYHVRQTPARAKAALDLHRHLLQLHYQYDQLLDGTPDRAIDDVLDDKAAKAFHELRTHLLELVQHFNSPTLAAELADEDRATPPPAPPSPPPPPRGLRPELN